MKLGFGTTLTWNAQAVAELTQINGIEITTDSVDTTSHDSSDTYKESIPGLIDAGEVSLEGGFDYTDTSGQHAMLTDMNAQTSRSVVITFPTATGATWSFTGYVTRLKIGDFPIDNVIAFSASIKVVGKPTFAVATSTGLTTPFFSLDSSATLVPAAANAVYDYVVTVLTAEDDIIITPTAAAGVITVDGNTVTSGAPSSAVALGAVDTVTSIDIVVTETSKAPVTYTLEVARASS